MSCKTYDPCLDGKLNQIGSYASVARQSAEASKASATQSATSASASATSATNSQNSANDAADSASEANNYLTQVTNIFNEFEEKYLGAFAIAPTADNQGNPLQVGALYWNSVTNTLFVWNGVSWSPIQTDELYLGGFAVAPTLNNQGLPLQSGNLYWNSVSNNLWAHNGTSWLRTNFNEFTPFLATGTTTPRNLVTREADVVNAEDFGASPTASATTNTAAIQAAIDYASTGSTSRQVFIPSGFYTTNAPLLVQSGIHLCGAGRARTLIAANHAGDGLVIQPTDAGSANSFLSGVQLSDFTITRTTSDNTGNAIWFRQCNGTLVSNVGANNHQYNFRITGGQLNMFSNVTSFCSTPFTANFTGACFLFERADIGGGSFQPCFTVSINNFVGSTNNLLPDIIRIHSVDGLNINNAYLAFGQQRLLRFGRQSSGDQITGVHISNTYFDCVDNVRDGIVVVPRAVQVANGPGVNGANDEGCRQVRFTNCFFANNDGENNFLIQVQKFCELQFSNCSFSNASDMGIAVNDTTASAAKGRYIIVGCLFKGTSEVNPGGGALYINNAEHIIINSNLFYNTITATYQILLTGNLVSGSVIGNVSDGSPSGDLLSTAGLTVSQKLIALNDDDPKVLFALPTSSVGLPSGAMWNNGGVVNIVP
jgi:hypothetical protein